MTDDRLEMFVQRYQNSDIPWDTGITPPEIVQVVKELTPGKALDIGCGTGTNVRYLLERAWQADGIDFVSQAVEAARLKLASFPQESYRIHRWDVTLLDRCPGLRSPYHLIIDIGCGHGFTGAQQVKYARDVAGQLAAGGTLMLYAHRPTPERDFGWTPDEVSGLFEPHLSIVWQALSEDSSSGSPAGWYRLTKT
jgi:SAM-dependent methyltransferase